MKTLSYEGSLDFQILFMRELDTPLWDRILYIDLIGVIDTTVLFSFEGAKNQRAPSEDYTFFHYC
jgi:hypothetical protein